MSYQVLARKWRPSTFSEMIGQQGVVNTLVYALDNNRLHHAYLFSGTRGVGKTTIARVFAKSINCEQGVSSKPCNQCSICVSINEGRHMDLIEVDAASRTKVEDTRDLLDNIQYAPTTGRFKIYLIDEVHMLSKHSFNALLKTLEEPPEHVKFLLATTDPQKLPITVLSRCLQLHLRNIQPHLISEHLAHILKQESIEFEQSALSELASVAQGSMRDALSLTDQAIAHNGGAVTLSGVIQMLGSIDRNKVVEILQALLSQNSETLFSLVDQLEEYAVDYLEVLDALLVLLHNIALTQQLKELINTHEQYADELMSLSKDPRLTPELIQIYYQILINGKRDISYAPTAKTGFEMVLIRLLAFKLLGGDETCVLEPNPIATEESVIEQNNNTDSASSAQHNANIVQFTPKSTDSISIDNWHIVFDTLEIEHIETSVISSHLSLVKVDDNHLEFTIEKSLYININKPDILNTLSEALTKYTGSKIDIAVSIGKPVSQLPTTYRQLQIKQRQEQALKTFGEQQHIKILLEAGGKIDPNSLQIDD